MCAVERRTVVVGQRFETETSRRMLRRDDLTEKITTFIDTDNHTAKPFRWTYDATLRKAA